MVTDLGALPGGGFTTGYAIGPGEQVAGYSDRSDQNTHAALWSPTGSGTFGVAGKHCESGDVLIQEVELADPRRGDVLVTPATGAYGHAMANNYNGVPRPPVVFCKDGQARVVVRRETLQDLTSRDA